MKLIYPKEWADFFNQHWNESHPTLLIEDRPFEICFISLIEKPALLAWFKYYDQQRVLLKFKRALKIKIAQTGSPSRSEIVKNACIFLEQHFLHSVPHHIGQAKTIKVLSVQYEKYQNYFQKVKLYFEQPAISASGSLKLKLDRLDCEEDAFWEQKMIFQKKLEDLILEIFEIEFDAYLNDTINCLFDADIIKDECDNSWSFFLPKIPQEPSEALRSLWKAIFNKKDQSVDSVESLKEALLAHRVHLYMAQSWVDNLGYEIELLRELHESSPLDREPPSFADVDFTTLGSYHHFEDLAQLSESDLFIELYPYERNAISLSQSVKTHLFLKLAQEKKYSLKDKIKFFACAITAKEFSFAKTIYDSCKGVVLELGGASYFDQEKLEYNLLAFFLSCSSQECQKDVFQNLMHSVSFKAQNVLKVAAFLVQYQSFQALKIFFQQLNHYRIKRLMNDTSWSEFLETIEQESPKSSLFLELIQEYVLPAFEKMNLKLIGTQIEKHLLFRYRSTLLSILKSLLNHHNAQEAKIVALIKRINTMSSFSLKEDVYSIYEKLVVYSAKNETSIALNELIQIVMMHPKGYTFFLEQLLRYEKSMLLPKSSNPINFKLFQTYLLYFFELAPKHFLDLYWLKSYLFLLSIKEQSGEVEDILKKISDICFTNEAHFLFAETLSYCKDLYSADDAFSSLTQAQTKQILLHLLSNSDQPIEKKTIFGAKQASVKFCQEKFSNCLELENQINWYTPMSVSRKRSVDPVSVEQSLKPTIKKNKTVRIEEEKTSEQLLLFTSPLRKTAEDRQIDQSTKIAEGFCGP